MPWSTHPLDVTKLGIFKIWQVQHLFEKGYKIEVQNFCGTLIPHSTKVRIFEMWKVQNHFQKYKTKKNKLSKSEFLTLEKYKIILRSSTKLMYRMLLHPNHPLHITKVRIFETWQVCKHCYWVNLQQLSDYEPGECDKITIWIMSVWLLWKSMDFFKNALALFTGILWKSI